MHSSPQTSRALSALYRLRFALAGAVVCTAVALPALGQAAPVGGNPPAQPGNGNGRGNRDPAQFRQRMEERLKEQLGATDDEWKALQPKVDKVMSLRAEAGGMGGGFMGGRRRGGGQGQNGGAAPATATPEANPDSVQAKARALRETLDNKDASADDIKAKLTALRDARAKAKAELTKAQEDLRGLLTARQEAVLVTYGMLE